MDKNNSMTRTSTGHLARRVVVAEGGDGSGGFQQLIDALWPSFVEGLTDGDAEANVLAFSDPIGPNAVVVIWHNEAGIEMFTVNGQAKPVAPGGLTFRPGGTPSAEVTIPADVECEVSVFAWTVE